MPAPRSTPDQPKSPNLPVLGGTKGCQQAACRCAAGKPPPSTRIASTLAMTMTELTMADLRVPAISSAVHARVTSTAGRLIQAPVTHDVVVGIGADRRVGQHRGNVDAYVAERRGHVARPADRDQRGREQVLEHDAPADDPGDEFAEGRVGVGVRAARDRHHRGVLGIAQAGEEAGHAREDEAQRHAGARAQRGHRTGQHEDAGADGITDAERGEIEDAERALERRMLATVSFGAQRLDRLSRPYPHVAQGTIAAIQRRQRE